MHAMRAIFIYYVLCTKAARTEMCRFDFHTKIYTFLFLYNFAHITKMCMLYKNQHVLFLQAFFLQSTKINMYYKNLHVKFSPIVCGTKINRLYKNQHVLIF